MLIRFLVSIVLSLSLSSAAFAEAGNVVMQTTTVKAKSGLKCLVYLFHAKDKKPSVLLSQNWGSGIYSTGSYGAAVEYAGIASLTERLHGGELALVMYDKPGVQYNPKDKTGTGDDPTVDKKTFVKHTLADMSDCAAAGMAWSDKIINPKKIIISGHSGGAVVAVDIVTAKKVSKKISSVILSGLPMEPLKDLFEWQLTHEKKEFVDEFWKNINNCTEDNMYLGWGIDPCGFFVEAFARPSVRSKLEKILKFRRAKQIRFHVFQGLGDERTRAEPVIEFDKFNRDLGMAKKPHLNWNARYYSALHNSSAFTPLHADMDMVLRYEIEH